MRRFAEQNPERFAELQAQALNELEHPPERLITSYTPPIGRINIDQEIIQFRAGRKDYYVHTTDAYGSNHLYFETLINENDAMRVLTERHPKFIERNEKVTKVEPCTYPLCQ